MRFSISVGENRIPVLITQFDKAKPPEVGVPPSLATGGGRLAGLGLLPLAKNNFWNFQAFACFSVSVMVIVREVDHLFLIQALRGCSRCSRHLRDKPGLVQISIRLGQGGWSELLLVGNDLQFG